MRKSLSIVLLLLTSITYTVCTQNLVPNGGFENLINLPIKKNPKKFFYYEPYSGNIPLKVNCAEWKAGTLATPDLRIYNADGYSACASKYKDCDRPYKGNVCAGIITYQKNQRYRSFREYLSVELTEALQIGQEVELRIWVRKERDAKLVTNNIGAYFAMKKVFEEVVDELALVPQINCERIINKSVSQWEEIIDTFLVDKEYKHLLIGNFKKSKNTNLEKYPNYTGEPYIPEYAYYLIDEVSLRYLHRIEQVVEKNNAAQVLERTVSHAVYFDHDKFILKPSAKNELIELLSGIHGKITKVSIHGHTDKNGTSRYNMELSMKRSEEVANFLTQTNQLSESDIELLYFGEDKPLNNNKTEMERGQNRRVEILIKYKNHGF